MQPYLNAMKSFDAVREACFGMELDDDYAQRIQKFKDDYLILFNDYQGRSKVQIIGGAGANGP